MTNFPKVIMLCGISGSGKTETGKRLADLMGYPYTDTDAAVAAKMGKSIPDIFREFGEGDFRAVERDVFREAVARRPHVISLGGGTVANAENLAYAEANGYLIYLRVSPKTAYYRLQAGSPRPMIQAEGSIEEMDAVVARIDELLKQREDHYCRADLTVDTEGKTPDEVADEIIDRLTSHE